MPRFPPLPLRRFQTNFQLHKRCKEVSGGILVEQRIVSSIGIAIEILRIAQASHERIRRDEPTEHSVIVPGFIEVEITGRVQFLARELVGHIDGGSGKALVRADIAIRIVGERLDSGPSAIGDRTGTAQVITVPIVHGPTRGARRNPGVVRPDEAAATGVRSGRIARAC